MKETKQFFVRENKLNRGYTNENDHDVREDKLEDLIEALPPVDVLAQYEEMHPGFVRNLIEYLEREQKHRHRAETKAADDAKAAVVKAQKIQVVLAVVAAITLIALSAFISSWVLDIIVLLLALAVIRQLFSGMRCIFSNWFTRKSNPKNQHHDKNRRGNSSRNASRGSRASGTSSSGGNRRRQNNNHNNSSNSGRGRRRIS